MITLSDAAFLLTITNRLADTDPDLTALIAQLEQLPEKFDYKNVKNLLRSMVIKDVETIRKICHKLKNQYEGAKLFPVERDNDYRAYALHITLLALAYYAPSNLEDPITLEIIESSERVAISTGAQFNIESLLAAHKTRQPREGETENNKYLLNVFSNTSMNSRDQDYVNSEVKRLQPFLKKHAKQLPGKIMTESDYTGKRLVAYRDLIRMGVEPAFAHHQLFSLGEIESRILIDLYQYGVRRNHLQRWYEQNPGDDPNRFTRNHSNLLIYLIENHHSVQSAFLRLATLSSEQALATQLLWGLGLQPEHFAHWRKDMEFTQAHTMQLKNLLEWNPFKAQEALNSMMDKKLENINPDRMQSRLNNLCHRLFVHLTIVRGFQERCAILVIEELKTIVRDFIESINLPPQLLINRKGHNQKIWNVVSNAFQQVFEESKIYGKHYIKSADLYLKIFQKVTDEMVSRDESEEVRSSFFPKQ